HLSGGPWPARGPAAIGALRGFHHGILAPGAADSMRVPWFWAHVGQRGRTVQRTPSARLRGNEPGAGRRHGDRLQRRERGLDLATGLAWLAFSLPHFLYHLEHLSNLASDMDRVLQTVSLGLTVLLALSVIRSYQQQ